MRVYLILLSFFIPLIFGCNDKGINDPDKRNENNIWFVDKSTGKGMWVPFGDRTTVDNGSYTAFYHNGKIMEKGKIVGKEHADTVFYYDITEQLIKYSVLKKDTTLNYYVNEGAYKAYSAMGELLVEGIVKDHQLGEEKWFGAFGHFIHVVDAALKAKISFHNLNLALVEGAQEAYNKSDSYISPAKLNNIDSLYEVSKKTALRSLNELNTIKTYDAMPVLKTTAVNAISAYIEHLNKSFPEILSIVKKGMTEKNKNRIFSILQVIQQTDKTPALFTKAQDDFQKKFPFDEEQDQFLMKNYGEYLTQ